MELLTHAKTDDPRLARQRLQAKWSQMEVSHALARRKSTHPSGLAPQMKPSKLESKTPPQRTPTMQAGKPALDMCCNMEWCAAKPAISKPMAWPSKTHCPTQEQRTPPMTQNQLHGRLQVQHSILRLTPNVINERPAQAQLPATVRPSRSNNARHSRSVHDPVMV